MLGGLGRGLALLQFGGDLLQDFRILDQVVLDDGFDLRALGRRDALGGRRQQKRREQDSRGGGEASAGSMSSAGPSGRQLVLALEEIMSSAFTQPGLPTGKRVLARVARSRAVRASPRITADKAEARSASARSPLRP